MGNDMFNEEQLAHAKATNEIDRLRLALETATARIARLERQRSEFDCRYAGPYAETSGVHCAMGQPCQSCQLAAAERERDEAREGKNGAYHERNLVVAALSKLFPSILMPHEDSPGEEWDEKWRTVVAIDLPTGQVTWHIEQDELPLFDHLARAMWSSWDGHDTSEKYRRLESLPYPLSRPAPPADAAREDAVTAWARLAVALLSRHESAWEHDPGPYDEGCDEDCRACEYVGLLRTGRAALSSTAPAPTAKETE